MQTDHEWMGLPFQNWLSLVSLTCVFLPVLVYTDYVTEIPQTKWLKRQAFISHSYGGQCWFLLWWNFASLLPHRQLSSLYILSCRKGWRSSLPSLLEGPNSTHEWLKDPKHLPPKTITLGIRFQHIRGSGGKHIQSTANPKTSFSTLNYV